MSSLTVPTTDVPEKLGEVNNNNEKLFIKNNNNILIAKKSLVKMTNREGSTRSLSCFKNPELSSKDLPLSEEMTLDMYRTNIGSNTGLKSKSFSSKGIDEQIQVTRLTKTKTEEENNSSNEIESNGGYGFSSESSTIKSLKSSGKFNENGEEKNKFNHKDSSVENVNAKSEGFVDGKMKNSSDFKRTDAFDVDSRLNSNESSDVRLSNLLKHREKVANIAAQESNEASSGRTSRDSMQEKQEIEILQVKQKSSEIGHKNGQHDYISNETSSAELHLQDNYSSHYSKILLNNNGQNSFNKIREQFDSFDASGEPNGKRIVNLTQSKQDLTMKQSQPINKQWVENVDVPLKRPEQRDDSNYNLKSSQHLEEIPSQIREESSVRTYNKHYHNGNHLPSFDSNIERGGSDDNSFDELVVADKMDKYQNDPNLKGKVGERTEYFSSLDKRLESNRDVRDWHASNRTAKPKHLDFFEGMDRNEGQYKNLRGRSEANRQKIGRREKSDVLGDEDLHRSLKQIYSMSSSDKTARQNQMRESSRNVRENKEHDYMELSDYLDYNKNIVYGNDKFINGHSDGFRDNNRMSKSGNLKEVNGDMSPVSDDPSDKESVGEYELQPRSGKSEVPSENDIKRMIEGGNKTFSHLHSQNSTNFPLNKSDSKAASYILKYEPGEDNFYDQLNQSNNSTIKDNHKYIKKPRGPGPNIGQIWFEEHARQYPAEAPTPPPMRQEMVDRYEDDETDYISDTNDELNDETPTKTIIKTITRQIKTTIPSGIVTVAQNENISTKPNIGVSGIITENKDKHHNLNKNFVSGFIDVDKEIQQPLRAPFPKELNNIEVITKNNPSYNYPRFDTRTVTPLPSQLYRHEGVMENYNEQMMAAPIIETELGVDPELKDAKKTGSTYRITMNITPSVMVSSRPGSAFPIQNSNFVSPQFSPPSSLVSQHNLISRHNSNTSSEPHNNLYMNGCGTSATPSVFSPPVEHSFHRSLQPNLSTYSDQGRSNGSGTVVVSITGAPSNNQQVSSQSDVAFNLSLSGTPSPGKSTSSITLSEVKSTPSRNKYPGEEIKETIEKTIITSTPTDITDNPKTFGNSSRSIQRKVVTEHNAKPRETKNSSRSGPREIVGEGRGTSSQSSRPEILYSSLNMSGIKKSLDVARNDRKGVETFPDESNKRPQHFEYENEIRQRKLEYENYGKRNGGKTEIINGQVSTTKYKNPLQSLDEDGNFDREVEVNKRFYNNYGKTTNIITNRENYGIRKSEGSSSMSSVRRMEQINKFDLQTLLRGATADSVKQKISVKRLGDNLNSGPTISEAMKESMTRCELPVSENDKVAEEISMNIDNGKVTMTSEILCEKTVPIYNSHDMYKTSSLLLTRIIEVDLSVTPERRKLYDLLVGPNIEERPLSAIEKQQLYKTFMTLAEHSRKGLL